MSVSGENDPFLDVILETADVPLLTLDADLRVKLANDAFLEQFAVSRDQTLGRLIFELGNGQWDIPELRQLLTKVLSRNEPIRNYRVEHTFQSLGRRVMRLSAKRMRSVDERGWIALAISDDTEREQLRSELEGRVEFADKLIDSIREGLLILHRDLRVHSANETFYDMFRVSRAETIGQLIYDLGNRQWNIPKLQQLLEDILPHNQAFDDLEVEHSFEDIGDRVMLLNARRLDHLNLIVLAIRDVTEQRTNEQQRLERERRQAFLLAFSDATRPLKDASAVCELAARRLGEELAASRALYFEITEAGLVIVAEYTDGVSPLQGQNLGQWSDATCLERQGRNNLIVVADVTRAHHSDELARLIQLQIGAYISIPFMVGGRLVGGLVVQDRTARDWSSAEVTLVQDVADRTRATVERLAAELERDRSEARFRALIESSSDVVYRMSPDWSEMRRLLGREFIVNTDQASKSWLETYILPDDQPTVLAAIGAAIRDKRVFEFEHRVLRKDGSVGWTLSRAVPLLDGHGNIVEWFGLAADITARKAAEEELRASDARARGQAREIETIYASAHVGLCVLDRDLRFKRINAKLAEINGIPIEDHIGRSVREVLPELADAVEPIAQRIFETGQPVLNLEFSGETPAQPGVRRTWVEQWLPLRDGSGRIVGLNIAVEEVTERKRAEQQLRAAHDTFRSLVDHSPFGIYVVNADFRLVHVSNGARKFFDNVRSLIGRDFTEVLRSIWSEPFASEAIERFRHTLATGERYRSTTVEERADTATLEAYDWLIERLTLPDGRPGVVCHFYDLSERLRHEEQLAIAAERAEIAQQAVHAMYYEFVPATGEAIQSPTASEVLTGYPYGSHPKTGAWWRSIIHPEDVESVWDEIEQGIAGGKGFKVDYRIRRADGRNIWVHDHANVIPASEGQSARVVGMVIDISEQKEREHREQLLMREVNHRSKNMLGLVAAVARQTATGDPQTFLERFTDRIHSLAASQDLLVKNNWKKVPVESLVRSQLGHFRGLVGTRIHLSGPPVSVTAAAAQALGMAVHELATNAAKYGALVNQNGSIAVGWSLSSDTGDALAFTVTWKESGGPPVSAPSRSGFGSKVIGDMVKMSLDGDVTLDYATTGLDWRVTCPAEKMLDSESFVRSIEQGRQTPPTNSVPGSRRVLIVEDEALIAMELIDMLKDAGYEVVGPAGSVGSALELLKEEGCDAAILDVNLGNESAAPVAQVLAERGTPFLTVSGYGSAQRPLEFSSAPHLNKPLRSERLVRTLQSCFSAHQQQ